MTPVRHLTLLSALVFTQIALSACSIFSLQRPIAPHADSDEQVFIIRVVQASVDQGRAPLRNVTVNLVYNGGLQTELGVTDARGLLRIPKQLIANTAAAGLAFSRPCDEDPLPPSGRCLDHVVFIHEFDFAKPGKTIEMP